MPKFYAHLGLCEEGKIKGCTDSEITAFGKKWSLNISPALWAYLRHLGSENPLQGTAYSLAISLQDIDYAMTEANQQKDWLEGKNLIEFIRYNNFRVNYDDASPEDNEGIYTPDINSLINSNDVLFYNYAPFSRSFSFMDSNEENPILYNMFSYRVLTSQFHTLTTTVRDVLFTFLEKHILSNLSERRIDNFQPGFESIDIYKELFKSLNNKEKLELRRLRDIFYQIKDREERETGNILSIGEYEADFIKYLEANNFSPFSFAKEAING